MSKAQDISSANVCFVESCMRRPPSEWNCDTNSDEWKTPFAPLMLQSKGQKFKHTIGTFKRLLYYFL